MKQRATIFIVMFLTVSAAYGYEVSDYNWVSYNGHQYAITLVYSNWAQAEAWAVEVGGHLTTINDNDENLWLGDFIKDAYIDYGVAWIGLEYKEGNMDDPSSWEWQNGEPVTFWNPDNIHGLYTGNHMYLHGSNHPGGREYLWNNNPVSDPLPGIIEVPEPATILLLGLGAIALRRRKK